MNHWNWAMYDDEGNAAVEQMMQIVKEALKNQPLPVVRNILHQCMKEVAKQHEEIYDTEVRDIITDEITKWASSACEMKINPDYWNL